MNIGFLLNGYLAKLQEKGEIAKENLFLWCCAFLLCMQCILWVEHSFRNFLIVNATVIANIYLNQIEVFMHMVSSGYKQATR